MICQGLGLDKTLGHGGVRFGGEWWGMVDWFAICRRYSNDGDEVLCMSIYACSNYPVSEKGIYFQGLTCESVHVCVYYCLS